MPPKQFNCKQCGHCCLEEGGVDANMRVNLKEPKKLFTVRIDAAVIKDIKLLSVHTGKPVSSILAETVSDLVKKLGRSEVAYNSATEAKKPKK